MPQGRQDVFRLWAPGAERLCFLPEALKAAGIEARALLNAPVREVYFDTDDDLLYRAGALCVMRTVGDEAHVAVESLRSAVIQDSALPQETVTVPAAGTPTLPLGTPATPWLESFLGGAPLKPRLDLQGQRTVFLIRPREGPECEISAETLQAEGGVESLAEVKLPRLPAFNATVQSALRVLRQTLDLSEAEDHRLVRWRRMTQWRAPGLTDLEDMALRRDDRFIDAAQRVLRRHLQRVLWHEPGARLGIDPEHLHDMRVAARRLRAALRVFAPALPSRRAAAFEEHLRWLASVLGRVRDLDVQLLQFDDETQGLPPEHAPSMSLYRRHLLRQREKARRQMLRALARLRYARFVKRFGAFVEAAPPRRPTAKEAHRPAVSAARRIIRADIRKVLRAGAAAVEQRTPILLHRLRIRCKRLRYACEFFEDFYGKPARQFAARVTELQDILGRHHDSIVARQTLAGLTHTIPVPRGRAREFGLAMGQLMQRHAFRAEQAEKEFLAEWRRFARPKTRRPLERRMERP